MNKLTQNNRVHEQTVDIPAPLEVHPSVDPELARGLLAAIEYIPLHRDEFKFTHAEFSEGKGCLICHAERLSNWRRPPIGERAKGNFGLKLSDITYPLGDWQRIFFTTADAQSYEKDGPMFARIEHFLRTGE